MSVMSSSPFKFLDAYGADDSTTFFGRNAEIEALYTLVVKSRLVLVYGPSGSGKTSLIQCGLANRFKPTDWFPVFVRRGEDLNTSLQQRINALATTPIDPAADIVAAARSLYLDFYRPLYFIFDQFEELFILRDDKHSDAARKASDDTEAATFFATIQSLLASDLNCRIIISMREEYIAWLQDFEAAVPTLFDSRLRVEQMTLGTVQEVIVDMTAAAGITLENGPQTAKKITEQMADRRVGVQLAYLQVYLDRLFDEAKKTATPMLFTDALVAKLGTFGDIMAEFLEEQTQAIANAVRSRHPSLPKGAVHRVLEALTTVEGTKQPLSRSKLAEAVPELAPMLDDLLAALDHSRIIRQTGDIIEVSHDQLAKRIAERRSADSKAVALVQRLVRDRLAGHEQTKTWLAAEELAKVEPVLPQLGLSKAEADFVKNSRVKLHWRRVRLVGSTVALIAVLAGFGIYAGVQSDRAFDAISAASETTNSMSATIVDRLRGRPGTDEVQRELLGQLKDLNAQLEFLDVDATSDAGFWLMILDGDLAQDRNDVTTTRANFSKALTDAEQRLVSSPDDQVWQRNVSIAANRLAAAEWDDANNDAALKYSRRAVAIFEQLAGAQPADSVTQRDLMIGYGNLAGYERSAGNLEAARAQVTRALAIAGKLEKAQPKFLDLQRDHGFYLGELGRIELASGDFDKARTAFVAAVALYEGIAKADPGRADWRKDVTYGRYELADVERQAGNWREAIAASQAAMASAEMLEPDQQKSYLPMLKTQRDLIDRRDRRVPAPAGTSG